MPPTSTASIRSRRSLPAMSAGVRLIGTGMHVPEACLTNDDLSRFMDTSDEWITQRTGIRERRLCDPTKGEGTTWLATQALRKALSEAGVAGREIDLVVVASVTGEMTCPATACRVAQEVGAGGAGAFDVLAACSGFVYGLNLAHDQIRSGSVGTVAVVGCDAMSTVMDYTNRGVSVLFGDAAGAAILQGCDDPTRGIVSRSMHADGGRWADLYIPQREHHLPADADRSVVELDSLQMNGREVYKFAVGTFSNLIRETLEDAGLTADDIDHYICHQSNARMLESARERFGIPPEKMHINIDRLGNCSAGSAATVLAELRLMGKARDGETVMFLAFGGGLTWASSLWQL